MFTFIVAYHEGRQSFTPVLSSFHKMCCPYFFQEEKNSEISPSFPLRFKLACIKWKSAANKGEKMNSSMSDVKQIYLFCQKTTRDKGLDELKT